VKLLDKRGVPLIEGDMYGDLHYGDDRPLSQRIRMGCAEPWSPRIEQAIAKLGGLARRQL
jgi:DNA-binding transcriptional MocR family regulator